MDDEEVTQYFLRHTFATVCQQYVRPDIVDIWMGDSPERLVSRVYTHFPDDFNEAVDQFFKGNIQLINNFMMTLAEQQIKAAFEQAEKEVTDLHSRISQDIREAKKNGTQIGLIHGTTLTTKKSLDCKIIIKKHSKDFGGTLDDPDVMKLCGCSRSSYYKYKREIKLDEK